MQKTAFAFVFLFALRVLAIAGPEQLSSGKEMKQVAPMPPSCPDWTGFYVGAFGGYKFSVVDTNIDPGAEIREHGLELVDPLETRDPDNLDNSGGELGGLIGFNYQWHNWVFGAEAAGGYLWARDSDHTGYDVIPGSNDDLKISSSFKTHYLATFGPRIGYAFCRWLPYVTGGLAVGDLDFEQSYEVRSSRGINFISRGDSSETSVGWMVGGGLEYALTNHWHLRGQYQYIDLGDTDFHSLAEGSLQGAGVFESRHRADLAEHNASFAILYKF